MMDRIQANQVAMLRTVSVHNGKHPEVLADIVMLATLTTELNAGLGRIDTAVAKAGTTVGVTQNKETARRMAISFAVPIAAAVKAEATKTNDAVLRGKVDYSKSDLAGMREEDYMPAAEGIATAAAGLTVQISQRGIKAEHLASLVSWNAAYRNQVAAPSATQTEITEANLTLANEIDGTMAMVREQMDPTAEAASLSFPNFASGYKSARVIIDRPGTQGGEGGADPVPPPV